MVEVVVCNCLVFMRRKGPSDEYQALEKVHVRFQIRTYTQT